MKKILLSLFLCLTTTGQFISPAQAEDAAKETLTSIFNGKDLDGWTTKEPNLFWKVVDGVLVGENDEAKKGSMIYTTKSYHDVILEADVRWQGEIDSGFMMRKPEIQMQIGISRSLKKDMTCSFYIGNYPEEGQAKTAEKFLKVGEWNKMRLQAKGDTYTVWLNGEKVAEYTNPKYKDEGPIGLQIHPGLAMKVEFKDVKVKELEAAK